MYRVPASTIPDPTGALPARPLAPAPGTLGLLLSWIELCMKIVHPADPGTTGVEPDGQEPISGEGWSSLFWELETRPLRLWSNSVFSIMRFPPELVPE